MDAIDFSRFTALKGEFEAEGLTRDFMAAEVIYAGRHGLDYCTKIGGCEAKSDIRFLCGIGVTSVVAPMIESPFAMRKYQEMLPEGVFHHVGVTIETVNAVERIEAILDADVKLTEVTIGRTDLTASFGGTGVDSPETMAMVKTVASAARARGLGATMGGSVNKGTRDLLRSDPALADILVSVETRKVVIPVAHFLEDGVLEDALRIEAVLLQFQSRAYSGVLAEAQNREQMIKARI
ncbi:MAG: hypothetical protein C0476_09975 [Sphingomonas sp.]|nr:hypothetical protein [Sphingomonas sp.]